jgi:hypothetical protein
MPHIVVNPVTGEVRAVEDLAFYLSIGWARVPVEAAHADTGSSVAEDPPEPDPDGDEPIRLTMRPATRPARKRPS